MVGLSCYSGKKFIVVFSLLLSAGFGCFVGWACCVGLFGWFNLLVFFFRFAWVFFIL